MEMRKIETYQQLLKEKDRTQKNIEQIQQNLRKRISKTGNTVNPILGVLKGIGNTSSNQGLLKVGVGSVLNYVIRKKLLKNASPLVRMGGGMLGKSLIAGILLKKLIGKKKNKDKG